MKTLRSLLCLGVAAALLFPPAAFAEGPKTILLALAITGPEASKLRRPKTEKEKQQDRKEGKQEEQEPTPDWNLLELDVKPWLEGKGFRVIPRLEKEDEEVALFSGTLVLSRDKSKRPTDEEVYTAILSARSVQRAATIWARAVSTSG